MNNNILADAELNLLGKKIKKEMSSITSSGTTLTSNEILQKWLSLQKIEEFY